MPKLDIYFENLTAVLRKLDLEALSREPVARALSDAADLVRADAETHRPTNPRRGAAGPGIGPITTRVGVEGTQPFAVVAVTSAKSSFRVPMALNYAKTRYHYRAGPYVGRSTRRWFTGALGRRRRSVTVLWDQTLKAIAARWGAG